MPKKTDDEWVPDERGRFRRKVGWWKNETGKVKEYPFTFGTNKDQAKARLARVRELWVEVEKLWRQEPLLVGSVGQLPTPDELKRRRESQPLWDSESLWIAKQLAKGSVQIPVGCVPEVHEHQYARKVQTLAAKYPFVNFVADDRERYENGRSFLERAATHQLLALEQQYPEGLQTKANIHKELTGTLHGSLDAYSRYVEKHTVEPSPEGPALSLYGSHKLANVTMLKRHLKDRPLSVLQDREGCQELLDYWRMRPLTKDKRIDPSRPMSRKTCQNHIAELMRYFRWLHHSKDFSWRKPEDFDELQTHVLDVDEERTSIAVYTERRAYLPSELPLLNKHATPLERLLLLLGLNCGFKGAEQGTLLLDHLFLDRPHPNERYLREVAKFEPRPDDKFVLYSRNKSKVYGEFLLWPQTVEMIRWGIEQRDQVARELQLPHRNLLLTKDGQRYYRKTGGGKNRSQIFNNKWQDLVERVQKNEKDFPYFSFSTLRDTAGDLVRQAADGEVSSTFLMHGQPVKKDDLLDLYTKRPFGKVFEALRRLQVDLKPMFDAAPENLVEQPMQQYTPMNKRDRIVELKKAGMKVTQIMEEVGVSRMTVLRTLERLYFRKNGKPSPPNATD
jgi:hypothetical protein